MRPHVNTIHVTTACLHCSKPIETTQARLDNGRGRYCSRACTASHIHKGLPKPASRANWAKAVEKLRGSTPWNKGEWITLTCETCGESFQRPPAAANELNASGQRRTRFCSRACSNIGHTKIRGREHPLFKEKITMTCEMCGKEVQVKPSLVSRFRFCSRRCSGHWVSQQWPRVSSIEKAVATELKSRGIQFVTQYAVAPYAIDIAFPEHRLAVEVDGAYWHGRPKQQVKDRRRDGYLKYHGWTVLRLGEVEIKADVAKCVNRIIALTL
jgi:very-short-patch-repair endonuclease